MIKHYILKFSSLLFLLFYVITACGQTIKVKGTVIAEDSHDPLPSVSVVIKGKAGKGTVTDGKGEYSLSVNKGAILVFSFIGYKDKSVKVEEHTVIDVALQPSSNAALGDVVIIGYKEEKQRNTTAAVTVISGKEIENLPAPSFQQALQGKVSGVNIQNFTGEPGTQNTFVVRGNTNLSTSLDNATALSGPLYVIDGVPMSVSDISNFNNATNTNVIAGIDINDIESIQVEKDAAATAIWGSRGANGVVIIQTKRGKLGKPQFTLNAYTGYTGKPALLQTETGTAERDMKINWLLGYNPYKGLWNIPQILTDSLNPNFNNATNWQGVFYRSGILHNVDMSISGASPTLNYFVNLGNYDEDGVVYGTGFTRYTFRSNLGFNISPKLNFQLNVSMSRVDRKRGLGGGGPFSNIPIDIITMPASFYKLTPLDLQLYHGQYDKLKDKNQNNQITAYAALNYKILPSLQYSLQGSVTNVGVNRDYMQPSVISSSGQSYAEADRTDDYTYNLNNILTWTNTFGKNNNVNALLVQNFQSQQQSYVNVYGSNLPNDNIQVVQGISQLNLGGYSDNRASALLSYAFQGHYDYKQKYLFDFTVRADGSSRFGADNKWGYFPSVSAGYIISDEPFFKSISWISMLKFRASWGVNGQQPDDFYAPWNSYNTAAGFYNGSDMATPSYTKGATQPTLTWEPTTQWNIGMDAFLLDHHLDITVDVYDKETRKMYYTFPLSFITGYTSQTSNAQLGVSNRGLEVNINTRNMPTHNKFQWNTNFNISYNQNLIAQLPDGGRDIVAGYNNVIFTQGEAIYELYQMVYKGVFTSKSQVPVEPLTGQNLTYWNGGIHPGPGDPIWVDINQDGTVWDNNPNGTISDHVATGNPNPSITGGFNNTLTYRNFSLSVGCTFTWDRTIINSYLQRQFDSWMFDGNTNAFATTRIPDLYAMNIYMPPKATADGKVPANPSNYHPTYPAMNPGGPYYYYFYPTNTIFNENGDYFKITNIALGYTLPEKLVQHFRLSQFRVYATLNNVYTYQKAKNLPDAEEVDQFGNYYGGAYPLPKTVTVGATVKF